MSSLDSALAALSSSAVMDIYKSLIGKEVSEKKLVWLSFKIGGITYGSPLGCFCWASQSAKAQTKQILWVTLGQKCQRMRSG